MRMWTDAAGQSRWLAAVLELNGAFYWSKIQTPDFIRQQLLGREDNLMCFQELLAGFLGLTTFGHI